MNKRKFYIGKLNRILLITLMLLAAVVCFGCGQNENNKPFNYTNTEFYASIPGNYDSADTAIIMNIDSEASTMTFLTLAINKRYTLNFDGATTFFDKYGQALTLAQLRPGELVDVTFMKTRKRLNSLAMAGGAFSLSGVKDFEIINDGHKIRIGKEEFSIPDDTVIMLSKGQGEMVDINNVDTLKLMGFDHTVKSIIVEQGHGYLRLTNDSFFIDGFIEINQEKVYVINANMLLAVPAGTVTVAVSNSGCLGMTTVEIPEGSEYELDVSEWQGKPQTGDIIFTIEPSGAKVHIDGKVVDISQPVTMDYGIHQMVIKADGYDTITKYIKVGSPTANLDITMEKTDDSKSASSNSANSASSNSVSSNSVSSNSVSSNTVSDNEITVIHPPKSPESSASENSASGNSVSGNSASDNSPVSDNNATGAQVITTDNEGKIYINAPEGVELYVDGNYIGVTPTSFTKKASSFVLTLRKMGFQSRSYTIEVSDFKIDDNYSFPDLAEL